MIQSTINPLNQGEDQMADTPVLLCRLGGKALAPTIVLLTSITLAAAQSTRLPPQVDQWKAQSDQSFSRVITIKGNVLSLPDSGAYTLKYYGYFPGQNPENMISPYVFEITPAKGKSSSAHSPFCPVKGHPDEGFVSLLLGQDVLGHPILTYTALDPASVPQTPATNQNVSLQTCEQETFYNPKNTAQ